jgi:hypothetical protein
MKKVTIAIILALQFFLSAAQDFVIPLNRTKSKLSQALTTNSISSFRIDLSIDTLFSKKIEPKNQEPFNELYFGKGYSYGEIGNPKLPSYKRLVQIPNESTCTIKIIGYNENEYVLSDYGIKSKLFPLQPSVSKSDNIEDLEFYYNKQNYQLSEYTNEPIATIEILGTLRGIRIARVQINPVRYNPVEGKIKVLNDIEVEITFEGYSKQKEDEIRKLTFSPYFESVFSNLLKPYNKGIYDNYSDLKRNPIVMQIVSHRMFELALQPFIEWKKKKGFQVNVAYTDEIGETANQIKDFVHNKYNNATTENPPPTFLVLVGDVQYLPASGIGSASRSSTDLYYASVDSDFFPEMFYGRMSATTPQQLTSIISKILYYEQYKFSNPAYLNNATLIAGEDNSWNFRVGEPTVKYGTKYYFNQAKGFNTVWGYGVEYDPNNPNNSPTYDGCYDNQRISVGFINYTAHCGVTEWSNPRLTGTTVNSMTNTNNYPLAIGNCCQSGDFGSLESIGETLLRAENKGAVTYIGSSPNTYWFEDFYWSVGAFPLKGYNDGYVPTFEETSMGAYDAPFKDDYVSTGALVFIGNLAVTEADINSYPVDSSPLYYWEAYNILGDPSLIPFFTEAEENTISHEEFLPIGANTFKVFALPGSLVALSYKGQLLGSTLIGPEGEVNLSIVPMTLPDQVDVVITRPQTKPYIGTISSTVVEGSYIVLTNLTISDSEGNKNFRADFGENFSINLTFTNIGKTNARNVTAKVIGEDQYFNSLTSNSVDFGDILADEGNNTKTVMEAFHFALRDSVPNNYISNLFIEIAENTIVWRYQLGIQANAPDLKLVRLEIQDNQSKIPNVLEPGETADMVFVIKNYGNAPSPAINSSVHLGISNLLVNGDNSSVHSTIEPNEQIEIKYSISAYPDVPYETLDTIILKLEYGAYKYTDSIRYIIGEIPTYIMGQLTEATVFRGRFYDSGGNNGEYSDNEDYTITFYPKEEGKVLSFNFEKVFIEGDLPNDLYDKLYIYNGTTTSSPQFEKSPVSSSLGVELGRITATNPMGAITFRFTSDYSVTMAGWSAEISNQDPVYPVIFEVSNSKNEKVGGATITVVEAQVSAATSDSGKAIFELKNGSYHFKVESPNYNDFTSDFVVEGKELKLLINMTLVGTNTLSNKNIAIYPNPFSSQIIVEGLTDFEEIKILNALGQIVYNSKIIQNEYIVIPTEHFQPGIYLLNFSNKKGENFTKRLIKR